MEETNNTDTNTPLEASLKDKKSPHFIAGTIALLILIVILFVTLNPADKVVAPALDDEMSESQDVASTTASSTDQAEDAVLGQTAEPENNITTNEQGEQVIVGDGFTAVVRPVTKETPIINEFTVRVSATGETCFFKWDVSKAQKCNLMSGAGTGVSNIGSAGSIQIDKGIYTLRCDGVGGGRVESESLTCL